MKMRKAPARRAAASSVPIVLIFMQVSTPSVFPSSQRSIQSCPAGQLHNSKEVGRTKTKDLSSYFLERGGATAARLTRRGGQFGTILHPSGLTTPSAPSLRSAQTLLLCEEGNFQRSFFQYRPVSRAFQVLLCLRGLNRVGEGADQESEKWSRVVRGRGKNERTKSPLLHLTQGLLGVPRPL